MIRVNRIAYVVLESPDLAASIERAWEARTEVTPATGGETREAVDQALDLMDRGALRVAERSIRGDAFMRIWNANGGEVGFDVAASRLTIHPAGDFRLIHQIEQGAVIGSERALCVGERGERGHADEVAAPGAVHVRLGPCGERRAFHADVAAAVVDSSAGASHLPGSVQQPPAHHRAERLCELNMHRGVIVERASAFVRLVDDLIDDDQIAGLDVFAQGSGCAAGDDVGDAEGFEGVDIGAVRDVAGTEQVAWAVALEYADIDALPLRFDDGRGRFAERRVEFDRLSLLRAEGIAKPGAADESDGQSAHGRMISGCAHRLVAPRCAYDLRFGEVRQSDMSVSKKDICASIIQVRTIRLMKSSETINRPGGIATNAERSIVDGVARPTRNGPWILLGEPGKFLRFVRLLEFSDGWLAIPTRIVHTIAGTHVFI